MGFLFSSFFTGEPVKCDASTHVDADIYLYITMSLSSRTLPRFSHLSNTVRETGKQQFLSSDCRDEYAWEIGMLHYYIRKVHLIGTRKSILDLFEYIMRIPAFIASNRTFRNIVSTKIMEISLDRDSEWIHLRWTILGFLDDLRFHPRYCQ